MPKASPKNCEIRTNVEQWIKAGIQQISIDEDRSESWIMRDLLIKELSRRERAQSITAPRRAAKHHSERLEQARINATTWVGE